MPIPVLYMLLGSPIFFSISELLGKQRPLHRLFVQGSIRRRRGANRHRIACVQEAQREGCRWGHFGRLHDVGQRGRVGRHAHDAVLQLCAEETCLAALAVELKCYIPIRQSFLIFLHSSRRCLLPQRHSMSFLPCIVVINCAGISTIHVSNRQRKNIDHA